MDFFRKSLYFVGKFLFLSGVKPFVCLFVLKGSLLRSYFLIRHTIHRVGHRTVTKWLLGWRLAFHYADMGKTTGHSGRNVPRNRLRFVVGPSVYDTVQQAVTFTALSVGKISSGLFT